MFQFLQPLYLLLLPAAALPVLLNLIKKRPRRRVPFPSLRLLAELDRRPARRRPGFVEILLLILRTAVVMFLIFLAGDLVYVSSGSAPVGPVAVVIDDSSSMAYADSGTPRFRKALRYADVLTDNEGTKLVFASAVPSHRSFVSGSGVNNRGPVGAGCLADAMVTALDSLEPAANKKAEIFVLSDLQRDSRLENLADAAFFHKRAKLTFIDVKAEARPAWNGGLESIQIKPAGPSHFELTVRAKQSGTPRLMGIKVGEEVFYSGAFPAPHAAWTVVLPAGRDFKVSAPGGFRGDDEVTVSLPAIAQAGYVLADGVPSAVFWKAAFEATGYRAEPSLADAELPAVAVCDLTTWHGDPRWRAFAGRGGVVVLLPQGGKESVVEGLTLGPAVSAHARGYFRAPRSESRPFSFRVGDIMPVAADGRWFPVAVTENGSPLILYYHLGKGGVYIFCFSPFGGNTDFFITPAIITFANLVWREALAARFPSFVPDVVLPVEEGDPSFYSPVDVARLFPGATVAKKVAGIARPNVSRLVTPTALLLFVLFIVEATAAGARTRR